MEAAIDEVRELFNCSEEEAKEIIECVEIIKGDLPF